WPCNINDLESAKYLAEVLGEKTVRTVGRSEREGADGASASYGETGRPRLAPDDIQNRRREVEIVSHPRGGPHDLRPSGHWNLQAAFGQLRERYPGTYWDPPLAYDPNPYSSRQKQEQRQDGGQQEQRQEKEAARPRDGRMSRAEALAVLGLREGATEAEIRAAYKRLMQKVHPDAGGSDWLARNLNAARDTLLAGR